MKRIGILVLTFAVLAAGLCPSGALGADDNKTTAGYRVAPLLEKLGALSPAELEEAAGKLPDLKGHWARGSVARLILLEIASGTPGGLYCPDCNIKADEFLKLIVRSLGFKPGQGDTNWAEPYIRLALEQKLIGKDEFKGYDLPITREQAVRIAVKAALLRDAQPNSNLDGLVREKVRDYAKIGDGYKQYILWSYGMGLAAMNREGCFWPRDALTRAEAAVLVLRCLDRKERKPYQPATEDYIDLPFFDEIVRVYAPAQLPQREVIKVARVVVENSSKSKGYVKNAYSAYSQVIVNDFFLNREEYDKYNVDSVSMVLNINTIDTPQQMEWPYQLLVYNADDTQKLHKIIIIEFFKFLFEKDADKALGQFDQYAKSSSDLEMECKRMLRFNNRQVFMKKFRGQVGFGVDISLPQAKLRGAR